MSSTPDRPIRVFIAEDHQITLWGLSQLILAARPRMDVIGTASTRADLLTHTALPAADVVVLDLVLGDDPDADLLRDVQARCRAQVLVLTGSDDPDVHREVVVKGARGVVHKSESAETILRAIEKVHAGEIWLHRNLIADVLGRLTNPTAPPPPAVADDPDARRLASLTPREREIVEVMVRRADAKQIAIAEDLGMSEHTLRNHLTTVYSKLGVRGRLELHVWATQQGLGETRRK
jgi:two-component system, NarL family, nitrate/nitrite response regulator NarL